MVWTKVVAGWRWWFGGARSVPPVAPTPVDAATIEAIREHLRFLEGRQADEAWLRKNVAGEPKTAMDSLTSDFLFRLLQDGLASSRETSALGLLANSVGPLAQYLQTIALRFLGDDPAVASIPVLIVPMPAFHAEALRMHGGSRTVLVNARLCRVIALIVDNAFCFDAAQRQRSVAVAEQFAHRMCELARFVAVGDPRHLMTLGAEAEYDRARTMLVYPVARNILLFAVLHEYGHHLLDHHAQSQRDGADTVAFEIAADAFAFDAYLRTIAGIGLPLEPIGAFVAILFRFYALCERFLGSEAPDVIEQAHRRLDALRAVSPNTVVRGIEKLEVAFGEIEEIGLRKSWLPAC